MFYIALEACNGFSYFHYLFLITTYALLVYIVSGTFIYEKVS